MSSSGAGFGNLAVRELRRKGYRVHLLHPSADVLAGVRCYRRFADLPEPVDAVLAVAPPEQAVAVVREAAAAGVRHVWLQQGAESPEALRLGAELALDVVAGECVLMFARPTGVHELHRWAWQLLRKIPA